VFDPKCWIVGKKARSLIGVFDPDDKGAAGLFGEQIVIQRSARAADVEWVGWRANLLIETGPGGLLIEGTGDHKHRKCNLAKWS